MKSLEMNMKCPVNSQDTIRDNKPGSCFHAFSSKSGNKKYGWSPVLKYPAQTELLQQHTPADSVYLIKRGMVKLIRVAPNGNQVIVGLRSRHWLIGAPAVLLEKPFSFTAVTLIPSALSFISAKDFLHLVQMDGHFSSQLNRLLSYEIYNQMKNIEAMSCMSGRDRLLRFLSDLILEQEPQELEKSPGLELPLKNHELAQILGITPEHLCRLLKEIEKTGWISRDKGIIIVTDPMAILRKAAL